MRAGLLREKVSFYGEVRVQNSAGELVKTSQLLLSTLCYRIKKQGGLLIDASEEFITSTVIIQIRKRAVIKEGMLFRYQGKDYRIMNLDDQIGDQTTIISGKKMNK